MEKKESVQKKQALSRAPKWRRWDDLRLYAEQKRTPPQPAEAEGEAANTFS